MRFGAFSLLCASDGDGDSAHVGAGITLVDRICHDEESDCALVTDEPDASRSRMRMRFSGSLSRSCRSSGLVFVDDEGERLLELLLVMTACLFLRLWLVVGEGLSSRADRQADVRRVGSSSEKR